MNEATRVDTPRVATIREREWLVPWRGTDLAARVFRPGKPGSAPVALLVHGWSGAQDANDVTIARELADRGYLAVTFDLAGHGRSGGTLDTATLADFQDQLVSVYDATVGLPDADPARISLCGTSLGAYLAAALLPHRPVAAVSLRVPANYPDEILHGPALREYIDSPAPRPWRERRLDSRATAALRGLAAFRGPVQLIEASLDEVIPRATIDNYLRAAAASPACTHERLPRATHTIYADAESARTAQRLLVEWLARYRAWRAASTPVP